MTEVIVSVITMVMVFLWHRKGFYPSTITSCHICRYYYKESRLFKIRSSFDLRSPVKLVCPHCVKKLKIDQTVFTY